ncbi:uncharacterized protein LOC122052111 [Zingiber officinale]|uniref:Uncharacterized protein n=1 Tax=Zingiber officinale TaxID=94328 RepID=A0A8J5LM61_ZINOF|nr:uncharacterized protein LOC122052111 [Zingiber officinale]KAG6521458.1 hypothetical protein ZIOFF_018577 [Zingiber officinale]
MAPKSRNFHHDQDLVQLTKRLRPCAEVLYIILFENYKDVVSILNALPLETIISHAMLLKDVAYTATRHVYYEFSNFLNFSDGCSHLFPKDDDSLYDGFLARHLDEVNKIGKINLASTGEDLMDNEKQDVAIDLFASLDTES